MIDKSLPLPPLIDQTRPRSSTVVQPRTINYIKKIDPLQFKIGEAQKTKRSIVTSAFCTYILLYISTVH